MQIPSWRMRHTKFSGIYEIQTGHLINKRKKTEKRKRKRTCQIVDFAAPKDHRVRIKEIEKIDKYLDLA